MVLCIIEYKKTEEKMLGEFLSSVFVLYYYAHWYLNITGGLVAITQH